MSVLVPDEIVEALGLFEPCRVIALRYRELDEAVLQAQELLSGNVLAPLLAEGIAHREGLDVNVRMSVTPQGTILVTKWDESAPTNESSKMPSLDALRKRAKDVEVDIDDLDGRQKAKILARIEAAEALMATEGEKETEPEPEPEETLTSDPLDDLDLDSLLG